jgi:hypothetical protein
LLAVVRTPRTRVTLKLVLVGNAAIALRTAAGTPAAVVSLTLLAVARFTLLLVGEIHPKAITLCVVARSHTAFVFLSVLAVPRTPRRQVTSKLLLVGYAAIALRTAAGTPADVISLTLLAVARTPRASVTFSILLVGNVAIALRTATGTPAGVASLTLLARTPRTRVTFELLLVGDAAIALRTAAGTPAGVASLTVLTIARTSRTQVAFKLLLIRDVTVARCRTRCLLSLTVGRLLAAAIRATSFRRSLLRSVLIFASTLLIALGLDAATLAGAASGI